MWLFMARQTELEVSYGPLLYVRVLAQGQHICTRNYIKGLNCHLVLITSLFKAIGINQLQQSLSMDFVLKICLELGRLVPSKKL